MKKKKYNMWRNSAYMIHKAWETQKSVLVLCLLVAATAVCTSLVQLFIAPIVLQKVENAAPLPELLATIGAFSLLVIAFAALDSYLSVNILSGRVNVRLSVIRDINRKFTTTSYPNTESTAIHESMQRAHDATNSNWAATEAIWDTLTNLIKDIAGFIIYLSLLSSLTPTLMMIAALTALVGLPFKKIIDEWGYRHRDEEAKYWNKLSVSQNIMCAREYAKDFRTFGMRPWIESVYRNTLNLYDKYLRREKRVFFATDVIDVLLSLLRNGIAYAYLISLTLKEGLPASTFLLYFTAISGFSNWITGILNDFHQLHRHSLELSCIREFLDWEEPFLFEEGKPLTPNPSGTYEISLNNVSFRYPGAEKDTIHNLNLTLHPGEKLAIVGLNGAGKTTLIKLLCGFYDPTEGEVFLNGENIKQYNRRDYYRLFAAVFQQFSVLECTLAENIAQSTDAIDPVKLKDCIEKAGLTKITENLPDRENTHIGREVYDDGVELSGGQTQRMMLARALYKDAPLVILDEPTAALDPIAENDIYLKYNEMTRGRSSIFISHRLASTRFCDRIIFLEGGTIAEEGTHDTLMAQNGAYASLFHVQSKYYTEGGADHE